MEEIFLKVIDLSITASWMVVAVLFLRLIFRRSPKWVCCFMWALVALRLVFPVSIESELSLLPSAELLPNDILYTETPKIDSGIGFIDDLINPLFSGAFSANDVANAGAIQTLISVFSWIWVYGAVAMLLYALMSYMRLKSRVAESTPFCENIKQCGNIASPFVLGIFNPRIYLPYSISNADIPYVVSHEKAHISRRDHLWKPIGFILLAIYWFNPLLWVAYILLCRDIERSCDEKVIREMKKEERRAYSTALLHCSVRHRAITACPTAFGETDVKGRIKGIMGYKKPASALVLLAITVTVATAVCLFTVPIQKDSIENTVAYSDSGDTGGSGIGHIGGNGRDHHEDGHHKDSHH